MSGQLSPRSHRASDSSRVVPPDSSLSTTVTSSARACSYGSASASPAGPLLRRSAGTAPSRCAGSRRGRTPLLRVTGRGQEHQARRRRRSAARVRCSVIAPPRPRRSNSGRTAIPATSLMPSVPRTAIATAGRLAVAASRAITPDAVLGPARGDVRLGGRRRLPEGLVLGRGQQRQQLGVGRRGDELEARPASGCSTRRRAGAPSAGAGRSTVNPAATSAGSTERGEAGQVFQPRRPDAAGERLVQRRDVRLGRFGAGSRGSRS